MKRILTSISAVLTVTALFAQPKAYEVKELTLKNGMTVWLNEDHSQPKVYGAVVVRAGAKDCPGTGIAHYFEHIMFKGTDRMGTVDYQAEKPWLDSISAQYDKLSLTKDEQQRATIQKHINELSLKAADYVIPNEFNRLISRYGGSGLNAGTGYDVTFYYNTFLPQFMTQWCWLNSERLIHPVFRGFQAELENVYEEKNRASDAMGDALNKALKVLFKDHPYAEPIIGTTENLKNPRLSDMEAFYKKYYVASNMGLILSGDFDSNSIQPLLEETFGRVQTGPVPERNIKPAPPTGKGQRAAVKLPVPLIKVAALVANGPTDYDPDAIALEMANGLLTNGKAGYLDSLTNEHAIMMGMAVRTAFNDAGVQVLAVVPKLPFGKKQKAIDACLAQVERIKKGDFSDERLEELKREALQDAEMSLETIGGRSEQLVDAFSQGQSWDKVLAQIDALKKLTRHDVVRVANKYFTDEYITFVKKFGIDNKETLKQPGYKPVQPKNADAKSDFAKQLEQLPVDEKNIRTIDMKNDAKRTVINPHVTLYTKENPMNDIFTFQLRYLDGSRHTPLLTQLAAYLSQLGTDSLTKQQLEAAWLKMGVTMDVEVTKTLFSFTLTGRDSQLDDALGLLAHFLKNAKADDKAMKEVINGVKVDDKSFGKEKDNVMKALLAWAVYGEKSDYLNKPSLKEVKALKDADMLALLEELKQYDCELTYCGKLPEGQVAQKAQAALPLNLCSKAKADTWLPMQQPKEDVVYFYNVPKARQNYIATYESLGSQPTWEQRTVANWWSQYMGGGMSSVLFQNVREFRSLAYSTGGRLYDEDMVRHQADPLGFITVTGTQADKSQDAMHIVDSLMHHMPVNSENMEAARQEMMSDIQNDYPTFRGMTDEVAALYRIGYDEDPNRHYAQLAPTLKPEAVSDFHRQHVAQNKRVWMVVGDRKRTDMKVLEKYGKVVVLKKEDIVR